jgi:hypothetical protein
MPAEFNGFLLDCHFDTSPEYVEGFDMFSGRVDFLAFFGHIPETRPCRGHSPYPPARMLKEPERS